jgi:thiol-disulfide isomerase/thioredoxin
MSIQHSNRPARLAWLFLLVFSLSVSLSPVSAAPDYKANVAKLDAVIKTKPNDESAHYYRAVSLQYLGEYRAAKADYDWVVNNGRNPVFRQYSQTAVQGLNRVLYGSGVPTAQRNTGSTQIASAPKTSSTVASVSHSGSKPQVYEFYTDWCHVCKAHEEEYNQLQNEVSSKVDFKRLNAEDPANADLAKKFTVEAYPTFVFVDTAGNCVFNKAGGFDSGYLKELIADKFKI